MNREGTSLRELALLFLRLGVTAFGGPAAHVAMMRDEVVRRRGWLSEERFLDLLGAANLIPGPNSTELAIHVGFERRRWAGLVVAGVCFIVPAMLMTGALGWAYVRFGARPRAAWLLWGVKPVILAVVVQALWKLAPTAARTWPLRALGALAAGACAFGGHELAILLGAGGAAVVLQRMRGRGQGGVAQVVPAVPVAAAAGAGAGAGVGMTGGAGLGAATVAVTSSGLFWVFLKIGSVLFGSGYVLLAFLRTNLVERLHWLSEAQLIDAVAAGQITPGPVFTTATFVGYLLAGPAGALAATAGIFLPAFVFVALSGPLVPRLRASRTAGAFLDGVNVASLALMAVVTVQLGRAAIVDAWTAALALGAAAVLLRFKVSSTWLIGAGAAVGLGAHAAGLVR
jgi:chromate transporter